MKSVDYRYTLKPDEGPVSLTANGRKLDSAKIHVSYKTTDGTKSWIYEAPRGKPLVISIGYQHLYRQAGHVHFVNKTKTDVKFFLGSYVDTKGQTVMLKRGSLKVSAEKATSLTLNRKPMIARQVRYLIETKAGASWWNTRFAGGKKLNVTITSSFLARHRMSVTKAKHRALGKLIGAVVAQKIGDSAVNNGKEVEFGDAVIGVLARAARNRLISSAIADAFPAFSLSERSAMSSVVGSILDGKLDKKSIESGLARQRYLRRLRSKNPDIARTAEALDFLKGLADRRRPGKK